MNELNAFENTRAGYESFREELTGELNKAANSFCRIGYLLKLARDTDILKESGYTDVNSFAEAEYGLDKTQVSRFININDRFSIGGNSEKLLPEYENYGSSKLSLMLLLPDSINEQLSPEYSKSDIQAIKEEYQEEQKITDIEVLLEEPKPEPENDSEMDEFILKVVDQLVEEHQGPAELCKDMLEDPLGLTIGDIMDVYMPDGDRAYNIRISGIGRFMISMKNAKIMIVNMRTDEKSPLEWEEFRETLRETLKNKDFLKTDSTGEKIAKKDKKDPVKRKESRVERSKASKSDSKRTDPDKNAIADERETSENEPEVMRNSDFAPVEGQSDVKNDGAAPTACQPSKPVDVWKDEENEAAGQAPKWYGKFMFDSRTQRMTVSAKLNAIVDKNRLINDVPPMNKVYIRDLIEELEACISGLKHIEDNWDYYSNKENQTDDE